MGTGPETSKKKKNREGRRDGGTDGQWRRGAEPPRSEDMVKQRELFQTHHWGGVFVSDSQMLRSAGPSPTSDWDA